MGVVAVTSPVGINRRDERKRRWWEGGSPDFSWMRRWRDSREVVAGSTSRIRVLSPRDFRNTIIAMKLGLGFGNSRVEEDDGLCEFLSVVAWRVLNG